ncbi:MAG: hypothetical protein ACOZAK_01455 [Patescibacteria group bacterium]
MKKIAELKTPLFNPFRTIKKYFSGQFLREIPGILISNDGSKAFKTTMYICSENILIYIKNFSDNSIALVQLEQRDNINIVDISESELKNTVNSASTTKSISISSTQPIMAITINKYSFLAGISNISAITSAGTDFVSGYAKVTYLLGKNYLTGINNLLLVMKAILNKETIKSFPKILPGSHKSISITKVYLTELLIIMFVLGLILGFISTLIYQQPKYFILFMAPFTITIITLLILDRIFKYK